MTWIAAYRITAGYRKGLAEGRVGAKRPTELWLDKSPDSPTTKPLTWLVFWRAGRSAAVPLFFDFPMISRVFSALAGVFRRKGGGDGQ